MPVVEVKVFEQYEYHDYLITIQDYYGGPSLEAFAVPTRFAHLFNFMGDIMFSDEIFEQNNIVYTEQRYDEEEKEYYEHDLYTMFTFDPNDTLVRLMDINTESSSMVLSFIINEMNVYFELKPKTVVIKQIYKKSITPKVSKNKRGFNQVAWASMVKLRDGKCMECSSVYDLHAHHIKSFKDNESLRYDVNNGITLCGECHRKWHKENGK